MSNQKTCPYCGKVLKKDNRTECYGCRCSRYFAKNGIATANHRLEKAIPHLAEKGVKVFRNMFNIGKNEESY